MDGLSGGSLEDIVNNYGYQQPVIDFFKVNQTFIGVDHVLEVRAAVNDEGK